MAEAGRPAERPFSHRIAALLALVALLAAGALSTWWIVTDRVELPAGGATPDATVERPAGP